MNRIKVLSFLSKIYSFKIIKDEYGLEYVVFKDSNLSSAEGIIDKTEFEAVENHVHLLDNVTRKEFDDLLPIAQSLGKSLLCCLKDTFPMKRFCVFVSITLKDSFIIRFHQKWPGEEPYYNLSDVDNLNEKLLLYEN